MSGKIKKSTADEPCPHKRIRTEVKSKYEQHRCLDCGRFTVAGDRFKARRIVLKLPDDWLSHPN